MPPSAARAYGAHRCPVAERAREACMWVHAERRIKPTESATMSAGKHPSTPPAGLGRVPLLHSWRHTRGVHESAGRGFALTQHAHIVIIAVLYTRTTVALAPPQAPSHTNVPHLSKGPPQLVPALRAPPQGCRIPILGRSVITYFRYADTYAGRPRLSSLVIRRVRMPTALSASVSNVPYNHPNPCSAPGNVGPAFPFCLDGPPRPPLPTTCRLLDPRPRPRAAAPPPSGPGEPDAACMGEAVPR